MIISLQMLKENKFSKILHHIKNEEITEKLELLNEIPTNNTAGIYVIDPESSEVIDTLKNIGPNLEKDDQEDGRDTTGLFAPDGTILTDIPPGDNSYILGPMMLIRYTYPSVRYELGYIGNGSRRFTALARINHNNSNFSSWDGNSGFTSYGQLSLEQAQWFRERFLENQVAQYRTFLNGPPPYFPYVYPGPDSYGRFLGWIIGVGRQIGGFIRNRIPPVMGPFDPNLPPGSANPLNKFGEFFGGIDDIFKKIAKGPEEFFPKGTLVGDAIQNAMKGGVKHSSEYNAILPVYLGLSILTGQKLEVPISPSATKDMVGKIDSNALSNVLKINVPTPTNAQETIKPTSGKTTSVMKDSMGWGAQGGLTYNYNTKTSQLEITSNKTLRTTSGGETVKTATEFGGMASPGKITSFSDIPSPTIPQVQDAATKLISTVSKKLGGPGLDSNLPLDIQLSGMRDKYNSNDISRVAVEMGLTLTKTMTQGAASNIVALRKVLVDNRIVPKSDIEKIGGAYGQVSNVYKVSYDDLPANIQKVIDKKVEVKESILLSESTKSIIKNIKKPYVLPEQPKVKYKVKLRANRTVNSNMMKTPEVPPEFKAQPNIWRKGELARNEMMSQQRKNDVLEMTGNSDWFWEHSTETSREKNRNIQYTNFGDKSEKIKGKVVRKEELEGDYLVFIQDQKTNRKKTILQSELNEILAKENTPKEFSQFFEQETIQVDNDPLFKKVSKRLKKEIDYSDKPAKNGYPNEPPPKMVNGWHPEYGKDKGYYNKLDSHSAEAMPKTGNDEVDAKVEKAKSKRFKIKEQKKYNWRRNISEDKRDYLRGKIMYEGMTSSGTFFTTLPATGDLAISSNNFSDPDTYLFSSSVSGTDVVMVSAEDSSPIEGANYTNLRQVRTGNIDTSKSTTIVVSVTKPTSDFPTWQDRDPLEDFNDNISVVAYSNSNPLETSVTLSVDFNGTQSFTLPSNLRVSDLRIQFSQFGLMPLPGSPDTGQPDATIRVITTQRQTPMNVFVSLDSPEASSFVRTGSGDLSPQEKQKKLKEMLEASDQYVQQIHGDDFPGSGAVLPGEYDPFKQAPPGEAGDTPGVEISQLYPADYDMERNTDTMLLKGLQRGDYGTGPAIDKQIQNIMKNMQRGTPGGLPKAQASQDTQIAADYTNQGGQRVLGPHTDVKYDKQMKMFVPSKPRPGALPVRVAHYEPEGELISEKKKLKSPEEVLNKIPGYYDGKPAPLGFPVEPPPKTVNGMHPDLVDGKKVADRFNRLDPESAKATPPTGNPHIDRKVRAARKKPK